MKGFWVRVKVSPGRSDISFCFSNMAEYLWVFFPLFLQEHDTEYESEQLCRIQFRYSRRWSAIIWPKRTDVNQTPRWEDAWHSPVDSNRLNYLLLSLLHTHTHTHTQKSQVRNSIHHRSAELDEFDGKFRWEIGDFEARVRRSPRRAVN